MLDFITVKETPWGNLATKIERQSDQSAQIVKELSQNFEVDVEPMKTDLLGHIPAYYAVRRTDTNKLLSVVNHYPTLVQNEQMFNIIEYLIPNEATFECGGALGLGQRVFGVFKFNQKLKLVDDDMESYVIVINDHTKSDGKITIINSPIRLVCMNMLQYAVSNSRYCYRVPCTNDISTNRNIGQSIFENSETYVQFANKVAEKLLKKQIDDVAHDKIIDVMFPYETTVEGDMIDNKANENTSIRREMFINCLNEDNLLNYDGTAYQYYQAMLDFTQHYFTNVNHAYDLNKRMSNLQGIGSTPESANVKKLLKVIDSVAA